MLALASAANLFALASTSFFNCFKCNAFAASAANLAVLALASASNFLASSAAFAANLVVSSLASAAIFFVFASTTFFNCFKCNVLAVSAANLAVFNFTSASIFSVCATALETNISALDFACFTNFFVLFSISLAILTAFTLVLTINCFPFNSVSVSIFFKVSIVSFSFALA